MTEYAVNFKVQSIYEPNTKENMQKWLTTYNELRARGIKLKASPQTPDEILMKKLYGRLKRSEYRQ